jgi:hypothetical protein
MSDKSASASDTQSESSGEFPEEKEFSLDSDSENEEVEDEEPNEDLYDLLVDFFVNKDGENIATILTSIKESIDQNSKCILKLTKVLNEGLNAKHVGK